MLKQLKQNLLQIQRTLNLKKRRRLLIETVYDG